MRPRSSTVLLVVPALTGAALFFFLSRSAAAGKSATYDEGVHLLSGYRILTAGDHDFNHEHPPLMKALAAAPVVWAGSAKPVEPWTYRREFDEWPLSHDWLYHINDGDALLSQGRLSIALVGAALALLVCLAAFSLAVPAGGSPRGSGWIVGPAAAALFATEPNLLAHGSLITTDMGMTALYFASALAFERFLASRGKKARVWMAVTGIVVGLALLAKFTAILLAPVFLAMGAAVILIERRAKPGAWRDLLLSLAIIAGVALLVLNAGYGFHGSFTSLSAMRLESESFRQHAKGTFGGVPIPVPAPWVAGFDHAEAGGQRWWSYLMGRHSMTGWRGYYIVAILVKTSIPLLTLAFAGIALRRRVDGLDQRRLLILMIPPAVLFTAFILSGNLKNIGLRYVLPLYPFLCLLGGLGAAALWRSWRVYGKAAAILLLLWAGSAEARIYPDHLAYFNEIAGGPEGGRWWLLDSNLDWGQDLKGLGAWVKANGVETIFLDYFGRACPRYYGITQTREFEGGWLAVSATNLAGVYSEDKTRYDFLSEVRPAAVIGHSILVYNVPRPPGWKPPPGGSPE